MIQSDVDAERTEDSKAADPGGPHIALITPYNGGNLGDAAIQDSMISNLKVRIPDVHFLGISLNRENFLRRHGVNAFPLLPTIDSRKARIEDSAGSLRRRARSRLLRVRRIGPVIDKCLNRIAAISREVRHSVEAYRILRTQDLLLISGGGQLDEEYGGPWRLPIAYLKWTFLAKLAGVPCAIASVGTGRLQTPQTRKLVRWVLKLCCYRSFRETRSRDVAARLLEGVKDDPVVADLAFSLPESQIPCGSAEVRNRAGGRRIVALSPICYAKPGQWPRPDAACYSRYLGEVAGVLESLIQSDYFVVVVCSSLGDDESVIPDLVARLDEKTRNSLERSCYFPPATTWRDFVSILQETDFLIASRLHGTILAFVSRIPVVAISFDPKVDWVMQDLGLEEYLLHFRDFRAQDVISALQKLEGARSQVVRQIAKYRHQVLSASESSRQFDHLSQLALHHANSRR